MSLADEGMKFMILEPNKGKQFRIDYFDISEKEKKNLLNTY